MTTKFLEDVSSILNVVMPKAEARAKLKGRVLAAIERSEIARLVRESLKGNREALETLQLYAGTPTSPAKPAPAVSETTDLGKALLEAAGHRSPFFAETAARSGAQIAEDASIPGATPGIADEIGRMPLINGDEKFHDLTRAWAMSVPFGGRRLDA
jgi:hypothetical protein